jgi:hypothetical protein
VHAAPAATSHATGGRAARAEQGVQGLQQIAGNFPAFFHRSRCTGLLVAAMRGAGSLRVAAAHDFVAHLREHAGAHQLGVDLLIKLFQRRQHVAIEQLVDDQLDAHVRAELVQRLAKSLRQDRRRDRVAGVIDLVTAADDRQSLVDREQVARKPRLVLADHAGDRQGLFQFVVRHQRQLDRTRWQRARARLGWLRRMGQLGKVAADRGQKAALHCRTALTHLAHAIEIMHLGGVVFRFLRKIEQRVVDMLEGVADPLLQTLAGDAAHGVEQLTDALAGRTLARAQVDDFGWITGFVHRQPLKTFATHNETRTGPASVDDKPKRVPVSFIDGPLWPQRPGRAQGAGKSASCSVPIPSSGNMTGMPSSTR